MLSIHAGNLSRVAESLPSLTHIWGCWGAELGFDPDGEQAHTQATNFYPDIWRGLSADLGDFYPDRYMAFGKIWQFLSGPYKGIWPGWRGSSVYCHYRPLGLRRRQLHPHGRDLRSGGI